MMVREVVLGDLIQPAEVRRAGDGRFPILSMTMREGLVDQADKFKKRVASADTSAYRVVEKGQLVVGFPIDEGVLSIQRLYPEAIVSPAYEIWDLVEGAGVDPMYLERYLRSPRALGYYRTKLQGSTARRRSLPRDIFLMLRVPVPDFKEQQRFIAALDLVDSLRTKRQESIALSDDLVSSIVERALPRDSEIVCLDEVLERRLRNGISPSSKGTHEGKVLTLSALTRGNFDESAWKMGLFESDPKQSYSVRPNVFMLVRGNGNKRLVGVGGFSSVAISDTVYPDTVLAAPIRESLIIPEYLEAIWKTRAVRRQVEAAARTTNGTFKVNQKTMGAVKFPLPSKGWQREFQQRVRAIRRVRDCHRDHLSKLDELFASIQQRAFNGIV